MKTYEETVWWCIVHRSISEAEDRHCRWDTLAGPRPGRGLCENVWAELSIEWDALEGTDNDKT